MAHDGSALAVDMIPGAVDLRVHGDAQALSPLDRIVLRANMAMKPRDGFGAPDKLIPIGLYARYSTGKQKQKSIDRQVCIVTAYMLARGYAIYVLYSDPARSARSKHRESLQRLLADCRAGKIRIIMVEDFDRWSRETFDAVELCEELIKLGVEFHSAGDGKALSKKETIEAALKAEADRDRRSLILAMGRFQHAAAGGAHSGEFFGYRYGEEPGFLVVYEPEADVIIAVFELAAAGVSFRSIGKIMKERGAPGPTPGCRWTGATVANILGQIAYTGRWYYPFTKTIYDRETNTSTIVLRHPDEMTKKQFEHLRIVSDDLFFTVNARRHPRDAKPSREPHFLAAKITCDCVGVTGQQFYVASRQMTCNRYQDGDTCPGRSHSVMQVPVERAVIGAIGDKVRSLVGEEDFATSVDRRLREAAARRRTERADVQREIADVRACLTRLLLDEIRGRYRSDIHDATHAVLDGQLAAAEARLRALPELPEVLGAEARLRALADTLDAIDGRLPFRAATAGEAQVSKALARLVRRVVVVRNYRPTGHMRVRVELDFLAFLHEDDGAVPTVGETEIVEVDVEQFMGRHGRLAAAAAELKRTGGHRIDDARWRLVAGLLPDVTSRRAEARHLSKRDVVDALLLRLKTGMPILSTAAGDPKVITWALARFVYAAGDRILLDALGAADPNFKTGLDLGPLEITRRRWGLDGDDWRRRRGIPSRLHALDGRTALDDAQWAASEPLLHPSVELSLKGGRGLPGRLLLEAVILALRSGAPWRRLPARFGERRALENSVRRLVCSGSWDKLVALWTERFPDLMDGLDVDRLAQMPRGSAQWRGPSPKRSRYARSGGLAPEERTEPQKRAVVGRRRQSV